MIEKIRANVQTNLKFYRRNRLLAGLGLLFVSISLLYVGASLLFSSSTGRFDLTRELFEQLTSFAFIFVAAVGLFLVNVQVRGKAVKLIFTKPCPQEVWLASAFVSAIVLAAVLFFSIAAITLVLSLIWRIPIQAGFAFLAAQRFFESVSAMAYLTFLSVILHPLIAIVMAVVFNESAFYAIRMGLIAAIKYTGGNIALPFLEKVTYVLYLLTPMFSPFADKLATIEQSWRVDASQWRYLFYTAGYSVVLATTLYLLTLIALRRKDFV